MQRTAACVPEGKGLHAAALAAAYRIKQARNRVRNRARVRIHAARCAHAREWGQAAISAAGTANKWWRGGVLPRQYPHGCRQLHSAGSGRVPPHPPQSLRKEMAKKAKNKRQKAVLAVFRRTCATACAGANLSALCMGGTCVATASTPARVQAAPRWYDCGICNFLCRFLRCRLHRMPVSSDTESAALACSRSGLLREACLASVLPAPCAHPCAFAALNHRALACACIRHGRRAGQPSALHHHE